MSNYGVYKPYDGTQALNREQWLQVAQDLLEVGPILQYSLEQTIKNYPDAADHIAALNPDTFEADIRIACAAITYVAEFAAEQCRFIIAKE